jgi:hypothetical protein
MKSQNKPPTTSAWISSLTVYLPFANDNDEESRRKRLVLRHYLSGHPSVEICRWFYEEQNNLSTRFRVRLRNGHANIRIPKHRKSRRAEPVEIQLEMLDPTAPRLSTLGAVLRDGFSNELERCCRAAITYAVSTTVRLEGVTFQHAYPRYQTEGLQSVQTFSRTHGRVLKSIDFGAIPSDFSDDLQLFDPDSGIAPASILSILDQGHPVQRFGSNTVRQLGLKRFPEPAGLEVAQSYALSGKLRDLHKLESRLHRFSFAELPTIPWTPTEIAPGAAFTQDRDMFGIDLLIRKHRGTAKGRQLNTLWRSHRPDWWDPDTIWQECAWRLAKLSDGIGRGFS